MRRILNRHIPFEAMIRWWYLPVGGGLLALILSLVTDYKPLVPLRDSIAIVEGHPSGRIEVTVLYFYPPDWNTDVLFAVLGLLLGCGAIWLLEEIRSHVQHVSKP